MDRDKELRTLAEADRHIELARIRIAEQEARIASGQFEGEDLAEADELLRIMRKTLQEFEDHRALIAQTIRDIDEGRA